MNCEHLSVIIQSAYSYVTHLNTTLFCFMLFFFGVNFFSVDIPTAAIAKEALEGHCIYDGGYCKLRLSYSRHTDLNVKVHKICCFFEVVCTYKTKCEGEENSNGCLREPYTCFFSSTSQRNLNQLSSF